MRYIARNPGVLNGYTQRAVMFAFFGPREVKGKQDAPTFDIPALVVLKNPDLHGRVRNGLEAMLDAAEEGLHTHR